jgi:hypothetical protein
MALSRRVQHLEAPLVFSVVNFAASVALCEHFLGAAG